MASAPRTTRNMFIASLVLLIISLVFSVTNVLTVVSAPLQVTVPSKIGYEGFLTDGSGNPLADGAYDLTFKLYSVASGGTAIATEVLNDTPVTDGLYSVVLQTFTASQFDGDRWLGLAVDAGAEITPDHPDHVSALCPQRPDRPKRRRGALEWHHQHAGGLRRRHGQR